MPSINNNFLKLTIFKSKIFTNSAWGILSNIFQNILFSIFFIVLARQYNTNDFANYIIANTMYGFIVAFSSLGLGQWFIRTYLETNNQQQLIYQFFKIQIIIGIVFYVINIMLSYSIYNSVVIRQLSLLMGFNILVDNIIYVIKFLNIAKQEQQKTFIILTIEALLKFCIACLLFIMYIPMLYLIIILIVLRLITLQLFIKWGINKSISILSIIQQKISYHHFKAIIFNNWSFIIIGTIAVLYWRVGNILISKLLTFKDVVHYEISYKLFSMAEILPVIVSTSIFPLLIKTFKNSNSFSVFRTAFIGYALYGIFVFTAIYSFADAIIPVLFGKQYTATAINCKEMFLTILIFPTALLQANVLVAIKLEKLDMLFNVISLLINIFITCLGLFYFKSLLVVNYAIFISFIVFHALQDIVLIQKKIISLYHVLLFYGIITFTIGSYILLASMFNSIYLFFIFWMLVAVIFFVLYTKKIVYFNKDALLSNTLQAKPIAIEQNI